MERGNKVGESKGKEEMVKIDTKAGVTIEKEKRHARGLQTKKLKEEGEYKKGEVTKKVKGRENR